MSRMGKKPVKIPEKVKAEYKNHILIVNGPMGTFNQSINPKLDIKIEDGHVHVLAIKQDKETDMVHGLYRSLVKNVLEGVLKGFKKDLEISGLGYKVAVEGKNLILNLGFAEPVKFEIPEGIKATAEKLTFLSLSGVDKILVGDTAARIRSLRPTEPYKGTGIRYAGEHIIRKVGKAAAAGAGGAVGAAPSGGAKK